MTRARRLALLSVAAAATVLAVGGCTDDGDSDASSPSTSSGAPTTTAPPASTRSLPTTKEAAVDLPGYNVYRPAELDATGEPLPVIVWANGGCVRHDATWETLLDRWAAAGFVVVSITQAPAGSTAAGGTSAADQAAAIDWAEQQHEKSGGPFAGRLDLDRVAAAGNSCGGITSLALAGSDPRPSAVFVVSGSSVGPGAPRDAAAAVIDQVNVPIGFAVGGTEDIARSQAEQDYDLAANIPAFVAGRANGDHVTVSTDPGILREIAEIGVNWMDFALNGNETARRALETNPCGECAPGLWAVRSRNLG